MEDRLRSFFDELEKIGAVGPIQAAGLLSFIERRDKRKRKQREMQRALELGYPAGWVALGMKPHGVG